jgi:N-methylhydantoinase A
VNQREDEGMQRAAAQNRDSASSVRVGCDIGGTFTDIVLELPDGTLFVNKTSTTPEDPALAIVRGLLTLLEEAHVGAGDVTEVVHGTTTASNTILQKTGARTGLITTRGFRDVLEIARIRTPTMFDLAWKKPEPLAERRFRREVTERIAADGTVIASIDPDEVLAVTRRLVDENVQAIAICFINSYVNPIHEQIAKRAIEESFSSLLVTASCEVLPEMKEYERTSTTVVNAYILPAMRTYLGKLRRDLESIGIRAPLQIMASNGGMMGVAAASERPVYAVASGPAGGVTGAARLGLVIDAQDLVVFDMGGTTAKASVIEAGVPGLTTEYEFRDGISASSRFIKGGGYAMKVPAIDIAEVGAGGGSIATIDAGGLLRVGPESAGADPGPACYDRGGDRPTVTDANMVLGLLNPRALAGGSLPVFPDRARAAIAREIAPPLGLSLVAAAHGIRHVANVNMARAIRAVTVERGRDPREMVMIAFGGSGPVHAVDVARLLGIRRIVAPVLAGVFASVGMLAADAEHNFLRAVLRPLHSCSSCEVQAIIDLLRDDGLVALVNEGYAEESVVLEASADLRYAGQSSNLTVRLPPGDVSTEALATLQRNFQRAYAETFGYSNEEPLELVNLRLVARGTSNARLDFRRAHVDAAALAGVEGEREVSFNRGEAPVTTPVVPRAHIKQAPRKGPLIIEAYDTTIAVPPGVTAWADEIGNVILEIEE